MYIQMVFDFFSQIYAFGYFFSRKQAIDFIKIFKCMQFEKKKNNLYDYCQQIEHLLHFDKTKVLLLTNTPCGLCVINRLVNFVVVNDS